MKAVLKTTNWKSYIDNSKVSSIIFENKSVDIHILTDFEIAKCRLYSAYGQRSFLEVKQQVEKFVETYLHSTNKSHLTPLDIIIREVDSFDGYIIDGVQRYNTIYNLLHNDAFIKKYVNVNDKADISKTRKEISDLLLNINIYNLSDFTEDEYKRFCEKYLNDHRIAKKDNKAKEVLYNTTPFGLFIKEKYIDGILDIQFEERKALPSNCIEIKKFLGQDDSNIIENASYLYYYIKSYNYRQTVNTEGKNITKLKWLKNLDEYSTKKFFDTDSLFFKNKTKDEKFNNKFIKFLEQITLIIKNTKYKRLRKNFLSDIAIIAYIQTNGELNLLPDTFDNLYTSYEKDAIKSYKGHPSLELIFRSQNFSNIKKDEDLYKAKKIVETYV